MTAISCDNDDFRLQAYCDGELDPISAVEFERLMAVDASLRARHDNIMALRGVLRSVPRKKLPEGLRDRVTSSLAVASPRRDVRRLYQRSWSWQALAASTVVGAILTGSVIFSIDRNDSRQDMARQIVGSHIRSLLAPQPFDIASSDRHTVKPWFTTRLPESPQVVELASQGFTLVGGRIDVVGTAPVATVVYRHAAHTVSLTSLRPGQSGFDQAIAGYNIRSWSDNHFTYVAVSDLPADELAGFEHAFAAAVSH
jgi:anti-sigma factor RsiW